MSLSWLSRARTLRPASILACLAIVAIPGLSSSAYSASPGDGDDGDGQAGECDIDRTWKSNFRSLTGSYAGHGTGLPVSDPVVLVANATHLIHLDLKCAGCEGFANRFIEMTTNIKYTYQVSTGESLLTDLANETSMFSTTLERQSVLFHAPTMKVGDVRNIQVKVTAVSLDTQKNPPKPPNFQLIGTFTISITRRLESTPITVDAPGVTATREREVNDINVSFVGAQENEFPGYEDPAESCWPNWGWFRGANITGSFWAGAQASPLTEFNEGDIVLLTAAGDDYDELEERCSPIVTGCAIDVDHINLPDTISYTWGSTAGTFLAGPNGRTVAFKLPDQPGVVDIWVDIDDMGGQFNDAVYQVPRQHFIIRESRRTITAAVVSTVNDPDVVVPTSFIATPANANTWMLAPDFWNMPRLAVFTPRYFRFNVGIGKWQYGTHGLSVPHSIQPANDDLHPWAHAVQAFKDSVNPAPPSQLTDFDGLKSWMEGKEFRHVSAVRAKARLRRDVVQEVMLDPAELKIAVHEGWTPTKHMTTAQRLVGLPAGAAFLEPFMAGEFDASSRTLRVVGEGFDMVGLLVEDKFRIGKKGNQLQQMMTNRDGAWIHGRMTAMISALHDVQASDIAHTATPQFPTHWLYIDEGHGLAQQVHQFPIATWSFINTAPKIDARKL